MSNSIGIDTLDRCLTQIIPDLLKLKDMIQLNLKFNCKMLLSCYSETKDLIQELYHVTGNSDVCDKIANFENEYSDVMDLAEEIYFTDKNDLINQVVPSAVSYLISINQKINEALSSIEIISALGKTLKTCYLNSSMDNFDAKILVELEHIKKNNVNLNLDFHYDIKSYLKFTNNMYSNICNEYITIYKDIEIDQRIDFLNNKLSSLE